MYVMIHLKVKVDVDKNGKDKFDEWLVYPSVKSTGREVLNKILKEVNRIYKRHNLPSTTYDTLAGNLGYGKYENDTVSSSFEEYIPMTRYRNRVHLMLLLIRDIFCGKKFKTWNVTVH